MTRLAPISSKKMIAVLLSLGFTEIRRKGSHRFFYHPDSRLTTVVPDHGSEDLGVGIVRKILRDIDMSPREFGAHR